MGRALTFASTCLATVVVTLTAAGCTTEVDADSGAGTHGRSQGQELTDAEQILVQRAEELLVKKCMERKGFSYWVGPTTSVEERGGYGYVLDDVGWAKKYGYGGQLEKEAVKARLNDPNLAYIEKLSPAEAVRYDKALAGDESGPTLSAELPGGGTVRTPRDSCRADAKDQLYGDFETWFRVKKTAENLTPLFVPDLLRDKRLVKALRVWATCMREAGHPYADPPEVRAELEELTEGLSSEEAHSTEVELATTEAICATESSLADTARTLEREYRDKALRQYDDDFAAYQRMEVAALPRAEDITGSHA
ncbi:hypothetical protein ACWIID_06985 [Streptomyces phaeochromogenes]